MTTQRYKISLLVLKNVSLIRYAHSYIFQYSKKKFVSLPCHVINILYVQHVHSPKY